MPMFRTSIAAALLLLVLLQGCGRKGPLFMPQVPAKPAPAAPAQPAQSQPEQTQTVPDQTIQNQAVPNQSEPKK